MSVSVAFDEGRIDRICAPFDRSGRPGLAVGIAIRGRPAYRKGFGLASVEQPQVLAPATRMRIGSTTKHFASLAFLLLCEKGKAGIDDPIGKHVPGLHPVARGITMRQLMGHVSGLRDAFDITWQFSGTTAPVTTDELLSMYRRIDDVNAPPMKTWTYNNGGYLLLSVAIERIAGLPLEAVLAESLFVPIGMHDTLLRRREADLVPRSATLHLTRADGGYERSPFFGTEFAGEGGIASTVDDMLRWLAHMDQPSLGSAAAWESLARPLHLGNGTSSGYGLGLFRSPYRGVEVISHPGGGMGGTAQMLKVPSLGLDVVVMANREDISPLQVADEILDASISGLEPPPAAFAGPTASGLFRSPASGRVIQLAGREASQVALIDGLETTLEPDGDGRLRPGGQARVFKQAIALDGEPERPTAIRFIDYGNEDTLTRVAPGSGAPVGGRYRCDAVDVTLDVTAEGADGLMTTCGPFGSLEYRLERLSGDLWRALPTRHTVGGILSFRPDRTGLGFSCPRTRGLPFRRLA